MGSTEGKSGICMSGYRLNYGTGPHCSRGGGGGGRGLFLYTTLTYTMLTHEHALEFISLVDILCYVYSMLVSDCLMDSRWEGGEAPGHVIGLLVFYCLFFSVFSRAGCISRAGYGG